MRRALAGGRGSFVGVRLRHADGTWRYLEGCGARRRRPGRESPSCWRRPATSRSGATGTTRRRAGACERDFVTNAAHDLRTPLAAISAAVEVLQQGAKHVPEERDAFLAELEQETAPSRPAHARAARARLKNTRAPARCCPASRWRSSPYSSTSPRACRSRTGSSPRSTAQRPALVALADRDVLEAGRSFRPGHERRQAHDLRERSTSSRAGVPDP